MNDQPKAASYEAFNKMLEESIAEANLNVSHTDFVAGVQTGSMGFKCMVGEPAQFLRGARRKIFEFLALLYSVAPFILVPLWAWHEHSCWLLIGIIVSAMGTWTAAHFVYDPPKQISIGVFIFLTVIVSWFCLGISSRITFFALAALWGSMFFVVADNAQREYALQSLVEDPELFNAATTQNRIMIVRKDDDA